MNIYIPSPELQIEFSYLLGVLQTQCLQEALLSTIEKLDIRELDGQLSHYVPSESLKVLARHGLRGELLFAVPCLLQTNPYLLGYYRLLLGFSQKEFYTTKFGVAGFKSMEAKGVISQKNSLLLPELCGALINSAENLIQGIGSDRVSKELLNDLTLLTVGPQLRGGANVKKGAAGIEDVFMAIHKIVESSAQESTARKIEVLNAAGRKVLIEFAPDPDIVIREEMSAGRFRNIIAIEVKGGTDFSNIHNRVGEAEKSHQKARASGFIECWTVVNVDAYDMGISRKESPSTNFFYRLSSIKAGRNEEYQDFKERIISLTGIRV